MESLGTVPSHVPRGTVVLRRPLSEDFNPCSHRKKCAVVNCPNVTFNETYRYFTFPTNDRRCQEWRRLANNPNLDKFNNDKLRRRYSICGRHFSKYQFFDGDRGRMRLKRWQTPTLNLLKSENDVLFDQEKENVEDRVNTETEITKEGSENDVVLDQEKENVEDHVNTVTEIMKEWAEEDTNLTNSVDKEPILPTVLNGSILKEHYQNNASNEFKHLNELVIEGNKAEENLDMVSMCRICLNVGTYNTKLTKPEDAISAYVKSMLQFVLPDINLDLYMDPVICRKCELHLRYAYEFKKKWLESEEILYQVMPTLGTGSYVIRPIINKVASETLLENCDDLNSETAMATTDHDYAKAYDPSDPNDQIIEQDQTISLNEVTQELEEIKNSTNQANDEQNERDVTEQTSQASPNGMQNIEDVCRKSYCSRRLEVPNIYNLLDESYNTYFSRIVKHAILKKRLKRLQKPQNGEPPYLCEFCGRIFSEWSQFQPHKQHHYHIKHRVESFFCEICGLTLKNVNVKDHYASHRPKPYKCRICQRQFSNEFFMERHMKFKHETDMTAQCHVCGKKMKRSSLRIHLNKHSPSQKIQCHVCDRLVPRLVFRTHMTKHQRGLYKCPFCDKMASTNYCLKNHIEVFHGKGGEHLCGICGKLFVTKTRLRRHLIQIHTGRKMHDRSLDVEESNVEC